VGARLRPGLKPRLVLDTGALIALERNDRRAFEHLKAASERGFLVVIPTTVVMEAFAQARSVERLNQVLKAINKELDLTPAVSHHVAALRHKAQMGSDADAIVVLEALAVPGSAILTDDRRDIEALIAAAGAHGQIPILSVSPDKR